MRDRWLWVMAFGALLMVVGWLGMVCAAVALGWLAV